MFVVSHRAHNLVVAPMADQFESLAISYKVPANFIEYLKGVGCNDIDSMALLATKEEHIEDKVLVASKAKGVDITELREQIAIKKLWMHCRTGLNTSSLSAPGVDSKTDQIPPEVALDIKARWKEVHGFVLPDSWLAAASCEKKIWDAVTENPPQVMVLLMEQIRLLSDFSKTSGTLINVVPGRAMEAAETITDVVHDNMEVYLRARGWLMTMAMLSIRKPVWFNLQTAIFAADKIMSLCLPITNGVYPATDHLSAAWASTVHFWSEQVRITNQSLGGFVKNAGTWGHKWAWTPPPPPCKQQRWTQ